MFQLKDDAAFKQHLRDFLVQTKSFADKNNADLYAEEAAQQREVGSCLGNALLLAHCLTLRLQECAMLVTRSSSQGPDNSCSW